MGVLNMADVNLTENRFFNRLDEINMLSSLLKSTESNLAHTILLNGIRGVGKTSLIEKIENKFNKEYLVVNIDLSRTDEYQQKNLTKSSLIKVIYDAIIKSSKEFGLKTIDKQLDEFFNTNGFKLDDISSYNYIAENEEKLANLTGKLPQKIYENNKDKLKGIFIFIDEIHLINDLNLLGSFIQKQKNVAYLFCGNMKDSSINDLNGAFGGRMLTIEIQPFLKETTKDYIESLHKNIKFDDGGFERFYMCTRGIPYYINIFAKFLPENIVLTENNIISLFKNSIDHLAIHFIFIWAKLTFQEQKIITSIIEKPLKRIEIANSLEVTSGSLNRPLNRFIDFDLIEYESDKYQITDPILSYWLKNSYEKNGVYPFRSF